MPSEPIVFADLIRGEVRFEPENVPDYVLTRADGFPLYTLTNPVDDATMKVSHVLRGEDLLSSTPRQIPLHHALRTLGFADGPLPEFGHLPFVLGEGNQKLSKRKTPEASLAYLRADGYLPEGVLNYLALLGWSIGGDRELFTVQEMADAFTLDKISRNSARWDVKKLAAINGIKIRELPVASFVSRLQPYLPAGADPAGGGRGGAARAGAGRAADRGGGPAAVPARAGGRVRARPVVGREGFQGRRGRGPGRGCGGSLRPVVVGRRRTCRRRCRARSWTVSGSSRGWRTGRCGWP